MDDLSFWDYGDINGSPFGHDEQSEADLSEGETMKETNFKIQRSNSVMTEHSGDEWGEKGSVLNAAIVGEALESNFDTVPSRMHRRQRSIARYIDSVGREIDKNAPHDNSSDEDWVSPPPQTSEDHYTSQMRHRKSKNFTTGSMPDLISSKSNLSSSPDDISPISPYPLSDPPASQTSESPSYTEYFGNAAYSLGNISRQMGLDSTAKHVASSVASYAGPAVSYAAQQTASYKNIVQTQATLVGISAIEKLGLAPHKQSYSVANSTDSVDLLSSSDVDDKQPRTVKHKSSTIWNGLGLNLSTRAPQDIPLSPTLSKRRLKKLSLSDIRTRHSNTSLASLGELPQKSPVDYKPRSSISESDSSSSAYDFQIEGLRNNELSQRILPENINGDHTPRNRSAILTTPPPILGFRVPSVSNLVSETTKPLDI